MIHPFLGPDRTLRNGWWILSFYLLLAAILVAVTTGMGVRDASPGIPLQAMMVAAATAAVIALRRDRPRSVLGTAASWRRGVPSGLAAGFVIWGVAAAALWASADVTWRWNEAGLQALLPGILVKRDEGFLDIGEGGEHSLAIGLQILKLHASRLLQLALEKEAVEDRLGQARRERIVPSARPEQRRKGGALRSGRAGELDLREECGARGFHTEVGRRKLRFGLADVGSLIKKLRRQAGRDPRHADLRGRSAAHSEISRSPCNENRKGGNVLPHRHLERGNRGLFRRHQRFLLRGRPATTASNG